MGFGKYWWSFCVGGLDSLAPVSLYTRSSSSSLFFSRSHITSADSAGFVSTFSSKHDSLVFSHEKFESFGNVLILVSGVLGRPNWASNGVIFVAAVGVMQSVLISSATSDASFYGVFFLSIFIIANLDFRVLISRSTIPIALWSSTGANITLI